MAKNKESGRIVIDYVIDRDNQNISASFSEGTPLDLVRVLSFAGNPFVDVAVNGTINFYLRNASREAFLASFFDAVAKADAELESKMAKADLMGMMAEAEMTRTKRRGDKS